MNKKKKIWLISPHMSGMEQKYVKEAFESNWIAPLGPNVEGFEAELSLFTGSGNVAVLNSGTAALHLALVVLNVKPGDVVLCQDLTFSATANAIRYVGAIPVFIDSEDQTWNMCPDQLEIAIRDCMAGNIVYNGECLAKQKPAAIIPVHLYGMPARMDEIMTIAGKFDIPVIEDAAESVGSLYKGRHTGTIGAMGILSFNGNKIITTSGGGALISDNSKCVEKVRFLATQARDAAVHYEHSQIGYNYRMSNVLAGIGRGQLKVIDERVLQHRDIFVRHNTYFKALNERGFNFLFQEEGEGMKSNRWLSAILVDPKLNQGLTRDAIISVLQDENIEARPLWKPMHLQPVFSEFPFYGTNKSGRLFEHGLCLPSGSNLKDEDFVRIFKTLNTLLL